MLEDVVELEKVVAVDPLNKCCETCVHYAEYYCKGIETPVVEFHDNCGDPAEFWCNHWQQKEEQK